MPGKYVGRAAVKMFAPDKNGIKTGSFLFGNSKAAHTFLVRAALLLPEPLPALFPFFFRGNIFFQDRIVNAVQLVPYQFQVKHLCKAQVRKCPGEHTEEGGKQV